MTCLVHAHIGTSPKGGLFFACLAAVSSVRLSISFEFTCREQGYISSLKVLSNSLAPRLSTPRFYLAAVENKTDISCLKTSRVLFTYINHSTQGCVQEHVSLS